MQFIEDLVRALEATNSKNEKIQLLDQYDGDLEELKLLLFMTYSPTVRFFTKYVPEKFHLLNDHPAPYLLKDALIQLKAVVASRMATGNAARAFLDELFFKTHVWSRELLARCIQKDLRCGVSRGIIDAVFPGLIPETEFSLCATDPRDIVFPAYSQIKEDGARVKLVWDTNEAVALTRNGSVVETHGVFNDWFHRQVGGFKIILDGEFVCFEGGKRMSRKQSNGIINKAVRGTITKEEAESIRFIAWDIETPGIVYSERLASLERIIGSLPDKVILVESREVSSMDDALAHFKEARSRGLEGTILKNKNWYWVGKRIRQQVKFKAEIEAEFFVDGYELGTGKNAGKVGALCCRSACGNIRFNVGIFKDMGEEVRAELLEQRPKVVTVLYNERIRAKGAEYESLFLPRVTALRWDKETANTLEEIIEIEAATLR